MVNPNLKSGEFRLQKPNYWRLHIKGNFPERILGMNARVHFRTNIHPRPGFKHLQPLVRLCAVSFHGLFWVLLVSLHLAGQTQSTESELKPLALPDLAPLNQGSQQYIETQFQNLSELLNRTDVPAGELASAFGKQGQIYQAHGFRAEALVAYQNAAFLMPEDPSWPYYEGFVYLEMARLVDAADAFQRALQVKPDDLHSLVRFGHVLLDLNQPEKAVKPLTKAVALDPNCALALYGLGVIASHSGHHQQAVTHFEKVLQQQPGATLINYPLGMAYRRLGNRDKARLYLQNRGEDPILFADPYLAKIKGVKTVSALQVVLQMAGDFKQVPGSSFEAFILKNLSGKKGVDTYLKDALAYRKSQAPDAPPEELARYHFAIAVVLGQNGSWSQARSQLEAALSLDARFLLAQIRLGDVWGKLENHSQAERRYQKARSLDPNNEEALFKHALSLVHINRKSEARAALEKLIERTPSHVQARLRLAEMIEGSDADAAVTHYRALTTMEMENEALARVHGNLAKLFQAGGRLDQAVNHYETALSLDSSRLDFRVNLAAAFGFLNRYNEAASQYEAILHQIPDSEMARLGQVAALVLGQNYGQAIERLEDGLKNQPENLRFSHLLARHLAVVPVPELRDGVRAEALARSCYERKKSVPYAETIAMALAQTGRFEEAVALQEQLVQATAGDPSQQAKLKANLVLYRDHRICCETMDPGVLLPP